MIACVTGIVITTQDVARDTALDDLLGAILRIVPRVRVGEDVVWMDVRGLPLPSIVNQIQSLLDKSGHDRAHARIGIAAVPSVAEVAARYATRDDLPVVIVRPGTERAFLAPCAIQQLHPDPSLFNLLEAAGVERCGELAKVSRAAVEVRFGMPGVRLWQLARGDDRRVMFDPIPRSQPHASLEWTEYAIKRAERLVFVLNSLCHTVCDTLHSQGEGAVELTMQFALANRATYDHALRVARPTADHAIWMRLIRLELEQIELPDAVSGITLTATRSGVLGEQQGDLFDRGFSTAPQAERAMTQVVDNRQGMIVAPQMTQHHLLERRSTWAPVPSIHELANNVAGKMVDTMSPTSGTPDKTALTLQLLPEPVRITVIAVNRRSEEVPRVYRDSDGMHTVVDVAGPDRVSGEWWDRGYARDYFRCVTEDGRLVWMYRDLKSGRWYLQGWWD